MDLRCQNCGWTCRFANIPISCERCGATDAMAAMKGKTFWACKQCGYTNDQSVYPAACGDCGRTRSYYDARKPIGEVNAKFTLDGKEYSAKDWKLTLTYPSAMSSTILGYDQVGNPVFSDLIPTGKDREMTGSEYVYQFVVVEGAEEECRVVDSGFIVASCEDQARVKVARSLDEGVGDDVEIHIRTF